MSENKQSEKQAKLEELAKLTGESVPNTIGFVEPIEVKKEVKESKPKKVKKEYNVIDGYRVIERIDLPFEGKLYPQNWQFCYRCPTTEEVANCSTVEENDYAKQITTMEDLIRACFTIVDTENSSTISSGELNDGDRLFDFLKIREYYLHENPISYNVFNSEYLQNVIVELRAESLIYEPLKQTLLDNYDGRTFSISVKGREDKIKFLCPTFNTSKRIVRYISEKRKRVQTKKTTKDDDINKTFILFLPYLFESGKETFERLEIKFDQIMKDRELFDRYMQIINKLSLTNKDQIQYGFKDEMFETGMEFPRFKEMFMDENINNSTDEDSEI